MREELEIEVSAKAVLEKVKEHKKRFEKSYKLLLKAFEKKAKEYEAQYHEFTVKVNVKGKEPVAPPKPENRTKDYDFYIEMLSNHISSVSGELIKVRRDVSYENYPNPLITLSETLWKRLWLDKWDWTFRHINDMQFYASLNYPNLSGQIAEIATDYDIT